MSIKDIILYDSERSPSDFDFDKLMCHFRMEQLLNPLDIEALHSIAKSVRYAGNPKAKYKKMDDILRNRGFVVYACGTNRRVYRFLEDNTFVLKVAVDKVGMQDNPKEFMNQEYIKPYVSKMFQMSQCGTVALCERVEPIRTRDEYVTYAGNIFDMLYMKVLGKFILEDIGDAAFMNYGIRRGFGPVLLDFPYMYEVELNDLKCHNIVDGHECGGLIDYDICFNNIVCKNCGKEYSGKDIGKPVKPKLPEGSPIIEGDDYDINKMRFTILDKDGNIIVDHSHRESDIMF